MEPLLIETEVFRDHRGYLFESFNMQRFQEQVGQGPVFVQDNHSHSDGPVLRGLHYQLHPAQQGKLVRVVRGEIFDVAVDVRRSSPGFGSWQGHLLSEDNRTQIWIPPGFAHGFLVTSDTADVVYKMTAYHTPARARAIRWDDPFLAIEWPLGGQTPILSDADASAPTLSEAEVFD